MRAQPDPCFLLRTLPRNASFLRLHNPSVPAICWLLVLIKGYFILTVNVLLIAAAEPVQEMTDDALGVLARLPAGEGSETEGVNALISLIELLENDRDLRGDALPELAEVIERWMDRCACSAIGF